MNEIFARHRMTSSGKTTGAVFDSVKISTDSGIESCGEQSGAKFMNMGTRQRGVTFEKKLPDIPRTFDSQDLVAN